MYETAQVIAFFEQVCQDATVQEALKPPCPATRQGFAAVAQAHGYNVEGADLDDYVRYYQFYGECQAAIARHQAGQEDLADWFAQWGRHLQRMERQAGRDRHDTIKRYM